MNRTTKTATLLSAAALAALTALPPTASAQQDMQQDMQQKPQSAQQKPDAKKLEREFVKAAANANLFEIEAGKVAEQKATRQDVKDYAAQISQAHQQNQEKLTQAAQSAGYKVPSELSDPAKKAKLRQLEKMESGPLFDSAYLFGQAGGHTTDVLVFEAAEAGVETQELKDYASETIAALEKHKEMAMSQSEQMIQMAGGQGGGRRPAMQAGERMGEGDTRDLERRQRRRPPWSANDARRDRQRDRRGRPRDRAPARSRPARAATMTPAQQRRSELETTAD